MNNSEKNRKVRRSAWTLAMSYHATGVSKDEAIRLAIENTSELWTKFEKEWEQKGAQLLDPTPDHS